MMIRQALGILLFFFLLPIVPTFAQDSVSVAAPDTVKLWQKGGSFGVNVAQVALKNWAAGGQPSFSVSGLINLFSNKKTTRMSWDNSLDIAYGTARLGGDVNEFRKTDDNFVLNTKYGRNMSKNWSLSGSSNFRTQMTRGYKYERIPNSDQERQILISDFMSPGYWLTSLGFSYRKDKTFSFMFSPITSKLTFVLNDTLSKQGVYGVKPGNKERSEVGSNINVEYRKDVMKNVKLNTRLILFDNFQKMQNVDINWDVQFLLKVNKFISSTIAAQMIYDDDINITRGGGSIGPSLQYKHVINVGFLYQI